MTAVHQVLAGAGPFDAVTEQARAWRRILTAAGYGGADHAAQMDPRMRDGFVALERLEPADGDLVVIRWSAWSPPLRALLELPNPLLVHYHNVTPPSYLWNHSPVVAVQCAVGRIELPAFARAATVASADSEFNAAELRGAGARETRVVPILLDPERLRPRAAEPPATGEPLLLSVGRLAPNKRHDLLFDAFAAYRRECAPGARLLVVGEAITPSYGELVRRLADDSGAGGAIELAGALAQPQLNAAYAAAGALVHLSDHEGFCVPLIEAFAFDLPVVAAAAGAMPEVGGDAVLWTDGDPAVTAELIDLAVRDAELRAELARRGRERLERLSPERVGAAVRDAVEAALA